MAEPVRGPSKEQTIETYVSNSNPDYDLVRVRPHFQCNRNTYINVIPEAALSSAGECTQKLSCPFNIMQSPFQSHVESSSKVGQQATSGTSIFFPAIRITDCCSPWICGTHNESFPLGCGFSRRPILAQCHSTIIVPRGSGHNYF